MIVYSCCCIGVFVMLGLIQIQNPFENFFEKSFENKKKKTKFFSLSLPLFWPNWPCFSRSAHPLWLTFPYGPRVTPAQLAATLAQAHSPCWAAPVRFSSLPLSLCPPVPVSSFR